MTPPLLCCCPEWLCHLGQGFTNVDHEYKNLYQSLCCVAMLASLVFMVPQPALVPLHTRMLYQMHIPTLTARKHLGMLSGCQLG